MKEDASGWMVDTALKGARRVEILADKIVTKLKKLHDLKDQGST